MKFPLLASFIVFVAWLTFELHKHRNLDEKYEKSFWEKEAEANSTRRKSLDDLAYIHIPYDSLPMHLMEDDAQVAEYLQILLELKNSTIVNFTGISNTALKLKYGAPNITLLTTYDQNYTILVRTLYRWGLKLYQSGYEDEARTIFEYAISCKTDVSGTYKLLAEIYKEHNQSEKIEELLQVAESLNSATKNFIVRMLQESDP